MLGTEGESPIEAKPHKEIKLQMKKKATQVKCCDSDNVVEVAGLEINPAIINHDYHRHRFRAPPLFVFFRCAVTIQ